MNDERIIEGGHGSRKSFISAQWRAGKGWVIFVVAMRPLAVLLLCCLVPVALAVRGGTVEAIPVAEVVRIVGGHGMLQR